LTFEPAQTCDFTRKSIAMDEMILLRDQRLLVKHVFLYIWFVKIQLKTYWG